MNNMQAPPFLYLILAMHEILSAPWFTEENVIEKLREHFGKNGSNNTDIVIESIGMNTFEADISFTFPQREVYGHALITVYGEIKEIDLKAFNLGI